MNLKNMYLAIATDKFPRNLISIAAFYFGVTLDD